MWYVAWLPPLVLHWLSSQIGTRTVLPCNELTASSIWWAQLLPLSESTSTGNESHWMDLGWRTSSVQLFLTPSRSRTMNEPPPVLHRGTMYSVPTGWPGGSWVSGWLTSHWSFWVPRLPFCEQSVMFTVNTTVRNLPPFVLPVTAIAAPVAVKLLSPMTRPKVVPNVRVPVAWTPWPFGGIAPLGLAPTTTARFGATMAPVESTGLPCQSVS